MAIPSTGLVSIVGAGPGDPELITLAARDRLQRAEVVIADYLANPALLLWCPPGCEIIQRRRGPRSDSPLPAGQSALRQPAVNEAMLSHARAGRRVVRLKGGDPWMFGRGAEEAEVLAAAGIAYEVIPGVSSPIAAPGAAGIPVTHRDHTPAVTFVSGFEAYDKAGLHVQWQHLARSAGTIVVMMSVGNARANAQRLVDAGRKADTPAAVVRWGTRGIQQTVVGTLSDIGDRIEAEGIRPPAVLVVGDVVSVRQRIAWVEKRALFGRRIAVTRSIAQGQPLRRALHEQGADVIPIPCLSIEPPTDPAALHDALRRIATDFDGIILSSPNGVRATFSAIIEAGLDLRVLAGKRIAVVGAATARACTEFGLSPDIIPEQARAEGLLDALGDTLSERWLLPRADEGRDVVPRGIRGAGGSCEVVVAYRAVRPSVPAMLVESLVPPQDGGEGLDAICFASGKTARHFLETTRELLGTTVAAAVLERAKVVSLGPVTTAALDKLGISADATASEPTDAAMTRAVCEVLARPAPT